MSIKGSIPGRFSTDLLALADLNLILTSLLRRALMPRYNPQALLEHAYDSGITRAQTRTVSAPELARLYWSAQAQL